jgi:8-oxo-dGTP diphosphatase
MWLKDEVGATVRTSVWIAVLCPATARVLIAKRARRARNPGQWNFFGGGLDRGERPEKAARRELREEAGIVVPVSDLVPLAELARGGKRHLLFGLEVVAEVRPKLNKESEESRWVRLADLLGHPVLHHATQHLTPLVGDWLQTLTPPVMPLPVMPLIVPAPEPILSSAASAGLSDVSDSQGSRRPQKKWVSLRRIFGGDSGSGASVSNRG